MQSTACARPLADTCRFVRSPRLFDSFDQNVIRSNDGDLDDGSAPPEERPRVTPLTRSEERSCARDRLAFQPVVA